MNDPVDDQAIFSLDGVQKRWRRLNAFQRAGILVIAAGLFIGIWASTGFAFDAGGFLGAILGIVAAVGIATRQFRKEEEQQRAQLAAMQDQIRATEQLWLKQVRRGEERAARILMEMTEQVIATLTPLIGVLFPPIIRSWAARREESTFPWDGVNAARPYVDAFSTTKPIWSTIADHEMVFDLAPPAAAYIHRLRDGFEEALERLESGALRLIYSSGQKETAFFLIECEGACAALSAGTSIMSILGPELGPGKSEEFENSFAAALDMLRSLQSFLDKADSAPSSEIEGIADFLERIWQR